MKVYIREKSWMARLAAKRLGTRRIAIVIGRTIYLYRVSREEFLANNHWVRHELEHIEQFRQYGWVRFSWLYVAESLKTGYYNNKYEKEARASERDINRIKEFTFI
jgi:hypothetical protein